MDELISRQAAIEAFNTDVDTLIVYGTENAATVKRYLNGVLEKIKQLPPAEEESFEWCTDCKEYDQEAHCCHRWSKMIRKTIEEMQIVHCIDCQHSEYDSVYGERWCHYNGKAEVVDDYHFCRDGERREDGRLNQQSSSTN